MRKEFAAAVMAALVGGTGVQAEVVSSKNRASLFISQTRVLDSRAAKQYNNSVRLQPPRVHTPTKWDTSPDFGGQYRGQYLGMARDAARRNGVNT